MARIPRLKIEDTKAIYHVITRTALDGYPIKDYDKEIMVGLIQQFARLYFTEIIGYCILDTHIHLLVKMYPGKNYSDTQIKERYKSFWGSIDEFSDEDIPSYRRK